MYGIWRVISMVICVESQKVLSSVKGLPPTTLTVHHHLYIGVGGGGGGGGGHRG